jgi:hypothetical protein
LVALFALAIFFVATSWRKWPDPLIDFGRELYVPWRLSHGALLYHDVSEQYGWPKRHETIFSATKLR